MKWNETLWTFYSQLNEKDKAEWLYERTACDESFFYFITSLIDTTFPPDKGPPASRILQKPICDFWQNPSKIRQACYEPRDWRKSTYLTACSAVWEYLQDNEVRILMASQKEDLVSKFLQFATRHILSNARLRWVYPELQQIDKAYTKAHPFSSKQCLLPRIGNYNEMTYQVVGITGASQGGHFDIIYCDDLIGEKGMESPLIMEDAFRWFDNVEELLVNADMSSLYPSKVRVIGTHWSNGDLGWYIKDKYPEYEWRIVPALKDVDVEDKENIKWIQNPHVEAGESNWPERTSTAHYVGMMNNPEKEMIFWAQHMNNPDKAVGSANKLDVELLRYYHFDEREEGLYIVCEKNDETAGEEFLVRAIPKFGLIDPGGFAETKMLKKGSRNAILIGGQPKDSTKKFVLYTWAGKLRRTDEFVNEVFNAHEFWKCWAWRIETIGAQEYIKKHLLEEAEKRGIRFPLSSMEINVKKDAKDDYIQTLMKPMERNEIYILRGNKSSNLRAEVKTYPNALTNDLVDLLGKMNVFFWHAKPMTETRGGWRKEVQEQMTRDEVTGY